MDGDKLPVAVHSETLRIGDIEIEVHVLDDGRRIVSAEALLLLWGLSPDDLAAMKEPSR
jgi:hypothetical protein